MKKLISSSKKRLLSLFLSTILVLTPLTSTYASQPKDVKDHWAKEVITEWVNKGLANGYPDGNFKPNSLITRAEFMTLTNKAFGFTEEEKISFSDVSEKAWYSKAIKIAKAAGYIGGYPDGTIKPINSITRQEVAIIIAKIKGLENNPSYSNIFTDANSIPTWSKGQIGALVHEGYMSGYPDGSFKASNSITRAEALVTLNRVLDPGAWIINETGTYGPSTGADIYYGDVTIKADGSILQNIIITGNLTITEDVGEGEVTLNNVIVEGNTYIRGGGPDSIYINGGDYKNIIIQKQGGKLRVVMINDKGASLIVAEESENTEIILEGIFDKVDINTSGVFLKIQGDTRIKEIKIDNKAEDVTISTSKDTVIDLVTANTLTNIINDGRIIRAEGTAVEASNYKSNLPDNLQPRPPSQSSGGGGGGGGGPSSIAVNAINVNPTTMTLIAGGVTGTIIATVSPNSASNKNVIWSSNNEAVATVVNGMVVPVAEGTAIIKATSSSDITKSAACVVTVTAPINNEPKLIVSPPQVTIDSLFNQAFTLTIQNDTVVNSVYANHISLGGVFEGINNSNVDRTNDTTITATLYGNLTYTGVGRITLDADALMNSTSSLYIDVIVSDGIEVPVNAISVTGSDTVISGQTLQLGLTIIPTNATNKEVTWSVTNETGEATIDSNGLLSAVKEGTVTVKATSKNDSSVFGEKHITITPPALSILNVNVSGTAKVGETLTLDIHMSDGQPAGDRVEYFAAVQESENSLNAIGYITVNSNTMTIPSTFELNEVGSTSIIGKHIDFGAKLKDVINSGIADRVGPISPATDLTYAINVSPVVGGTATVDVDKSVAAAGEIVSVTISNIQSGKQFKSILVNGGAVATTEVSAGASYTFVMPSAFATVVVEIEDEPIVTYSVTVSPVVGRTATVNVDKSVAAAGEIVSVTISNIQSGKQFKSIQVNGGAIAPTEISEGASYTFIMPSASATVVVEIEDEPITSPQGLLLDAEAGTNFTGVLYTRGGNIYYNKQDNNGIWDTEALIGVGLEGKLAIDGSDKPHVVYTTPENKIGYRKYDVSGWIEEVLIESNNSGACSKPDIAVDGNGHAHITYTDTKGELYGLWDYEDIMYANNSTGNFVKQVITKGYRDNSTSPWFIFRYLKGSTITINSDGNYIITLHRYFQYRDSGMPAVTTHHYGVEAKTFGASGVTTNTSSTNTDTADIYNSITKNGKTIVLYKERTFKTSELVISGGTIDFTNTNNISVSTVKSVSTDGTNVVVVGTNSGKLQAQYNDTVQDFYEIEVGSNAVYIVNIDGKFYAVYTDASDQMIKMTEVTEYN